MTTAAPTNRILSLKGAAVTLNEIRKHSPCEVGWRTFLSHLGKTKADDEPVSLITILNSNGVDDALWCLRALPAEYDPAVRLMVCDMVEPSLKYVPDGEDRPRRAIETARRHARGEASDEELAAARGAAMEAAWAASRGASMAAGAALRVAAIYALRAALRAASMAAATDASMAAARAAQTQIFRDHFNS